MRVFRGEVHFLGDRFFSCHLLMMSSLLILMYDGLTV